MSGIRSSRVSLYEIALGDPEPHLILLPTSLEPGHLPDSPHEGWVATIHGDRVLFSTPDYTVIIWDYIRGQYTPLGIANGVDDCDIPLTVRFMAAYKPFCHLPTSLY